MALSTVTTNSGRGGLFSAAATTSTKSPPYATLPHPLRRRAVFPNPTAYPTTSRTARGTSHVTTAKKLSSRTGRFDSKNRRSNTTTKEEQDEIDESTATIDYSVNGSSFGGGNGSAVESNGALVVNSEGVPMPKLPGLEKSFWEGPQMDGVGFFVQYMWAFGIGFAACYCVMDCLVSVPGHRVLEMFAYQLIACGVAVSTYNEGATDFKETPAYKDSIGSSNLLEEPEASKSDIFESNPTEDAPSLE